jgi:hypothetical protein
MTNREKFIAMFQFFGMNGFQAELTYRLDRTARLSLAHDFGERELIFEDSRDATPEVCSELLAEMVNELMRPVCPFQSSVLLV